MENEVMINCNKRTFANNDECIYCKYKLKEKEHNFNKEIYDFLYSKYNESKNKPQAIKAGMEKFGINMKEAKEIVDYISEQIYHKEETEKNAEIVKKRSQPKEELPTNGIDYSKYTNYDSKYYGGNGYKKFLSLKFIGLILYWVILAFMWAEKIGSIEIRVFALVLSIILFIKTISRSEVPLNPHTFVFSFFEYFMHCILPMTIIMIPLGAILVKIILYVTNSSQPIYISGLVGVVLLLIFWVKFGKQMGHEFTVDNGVIRYENVIKSWNNSDDTYSTSTRNTIVEYYDISYIKEVKETLNSIIIYGDIKKNIDKRYGGRTHEISTEKINKLKITKSFKNNKNLIKALKICAGEYK